MARSTLLAVLFSALLWSVAAPLLPAQRGKVEPCPWCEEDPGIAERGGIVSHGPFPLVKGTSDDLVALAERTEWRFLETEHMRWASSLPAQRVSSRDMKRLEAEIDAFREVIPNLPKRVTKLDPWLRLHFMAWRAERFYLRFQGLLGVTDADFPHERSGDGPFMGDGRYLGEKDKFEIVLHERISTHKKFTKASMGVELEDAVRWHCNQPHKLVASLQCEHSDLKDDRWLYPHVVHVLSHMMFCAYKHFSFDPPMWLDEGLAHVMEREVDPESWTREAEEGTTVDRGGPSNWIGADRKLARRGRSTDLGALFDKKSLAYMSENDHISAWSKVRFLVEAHPEKFAAFLGAIKGQLDERGYPSGKDLTGLQRKQLRELWGWTPQQFDQEWEAWVLGGEDED